MQAEEKADERKQRTRTLQMHLPFCLTIICIIDMVVNVF